jgi:ribosomal protein S18 acetylase RimI-like enzyme
VRGAEVFRLYVQRPFLRRGLGRALMAKAEASAPARGLDAIWLTAWAGNHGALAFYQSQGFRDVGVTEYVIDGVGYENRVLCKTLAR